MPFRRIAIVGLGLMGGSLAAACRKQFPRSKIMGISRKQSAVRAALKKKWIHQGSCNLQAVKDADLVILCTPIDVFPAYLKQLDSIVQPGTYVTDVGSAKQSVLKEIRRRFKNICYVSAHPMVGSHEQGIDAADASLYDHGLTFVIRNRKIKSSDLEKVRLFWKKISAQTVEVSAQEHDRIVAAISHLPHILAVTLMQSVPQQTAKFAGSGFRDVTRIAQGHPDIWTPILKQNRKEILAAAKVFTRRLAQILKLLAPSKSRSLDLLLDQTRKKRAQI